MMADKVLTAEGDLYTAPLKLHIDSFLSQFRLKGYADRTVKKKRAAVTGFIRWIAENRIPTADLNEADLTAYAEHRSNLCLNTELATLRLFLKHLGAELDLPISILQSNPSKTHGLKQGYLDYLRKERGLTENTIHVYFPYIRDFLNEQIAKTGYVLAEDFKASTIQDYLSDHTRNRSSEYTRLLATALRSFFRFLFLRGKTATDLSLSVPTVHKWREAKPPPYLLPEEIERVLSATDQSIPRGRRDYAILLLLARLGLRASEVIALELGDIRWRSAEIVIHGKGRVVSRLPLLADIGEALARYLSKDRGASTSRQVFLRMLAPRVGLAGPGAICHIVRRTLRQAGVQRPPQVASHLFRHSLATQMIRQGASIAEISEILRHRSQSTTAIYAKVDFDSLRKVARCWPGKGGVR